MKQVERTITWDQRAGHMRPKKTITALAVVLLIMASSALTTFAQRTASATAIVDNGYLVHINVTDGGAGYNLSNGVGGAIAPPAVTITGGGGSGAAALATVSNGMVAQIAVVSPGSNYASTPSVLVAPPPPVFNALAMQMAPVLVVNGELGRTVQVEYAESAEPTQWISITNVVLGSNGFQWVDPSTDAPNRIYQAVSVPPDVSPVARTAVATADIAYGFIVEYTVTDGGANYLTPPSITIVGDGSSATASATISNGVVTAITSVDVGSGYSYASVEISAPPQVTTLNQYKVPRITASWPVPTTMILQSTAGLDGTNSWTNLFTMCFSTNGPPQLAGTTSWTNLSSIALGSNSVVFIDSTATQATRYYQLTTAPFISATGGDYAFPYGDYMIHVFINSGTFTILSGEGTIESLVVAGGGAAGTLGRTGGGGAGGLAYTAPGNSYIYGPGIIRLL